jgi:hypothetical protein
MHVTTEEEHNTIVARFNSMKCLSLNVIVVFYLAVINEQLTTGKGLGFSIKVVNIS